MGTYDKLANKISWEEMGLRLQKKRERHFSIVISNRIIILGGYVDGEDIVEILEGNELKQGPNIPFKLNSNVDQVVVDRKRRIIIISKDHGVIVYDHTKRKFTPYDNLKLRELRYNYAAILQ